MEDEVLACHKTGYALVPVQTICAIRASGNYTEVLAARDQSHLFRRALKEWRDRLPAPPFLRLDRSVIVNAQSMCGWQSRGRRLELRFEGLSKTLTLGRAGLGSIQEVPERPGRRDGMNPRKKLPLLFGPWPIRHKYGRLRPKSALQPFEFPLSNPYSPPVQTRLKG